MIALKQKLTRAVLGAEAAALRALRAFRREPLAIGTALFAILLLLITLVLVRMSQPTFFVTYGQLIATVALALITLFYVVLTYGMLREARSARKQEHAPLVIVAVEYNAPVHAALIVVTNVGRGAARNVMFVFTPQPNDGQGKPLSRHPVFDKGIPMLAPGARFPVFFGFVDQILSPEKSQATPTFQVEVQYQSLFDNEVLKQSFPIDYTVLLGIIGGCSMEYQMQELVRQLRNIRDELRTKLR